MPTKKFVQTFVLLTMMPSAILWLHAQSSQNVPGIALDQLELHNVKAEAANYNGKPAVRVEALPDAANGASYAILKGSRFHNGTIEVELAGKPGANAGPGARGFIGIAFRVQGNRFEYIYLRPTNGRADDQIRRNHTTQYAAHPEFDFNRLRKESPEKYESYVDLEPGVWTKYRIVIERDKGTAVRPWGSATLSDRRRYEVWRFGGRGGPVCRARHGRLLRQS